tara:strand:- start:2993 stop:3769 length:777 start_codon:yes stop_codon:yes gene_type:complete
MSQFIPFLNYSIPDILELFGQPSLSSFYMVFLPLGSVGTPLSIEFNDKNLYNTDKDGYRLEEKISLLCTDATLPGATYNTFQVKGNRQGVVEQYPNYKIYPPVDFSFMVDNNHSVLRLFDTWMNFISPLNGDEDDINSFYRFRYPEEYTIDFYIVKFEKEEGAWKGKKSLPDPNIPINATTANAFYQSKKTVYKFKRAYPKNMASIPLSYDGSTLIKSSVTFQYDRFYTFDIEKNRTPDFIKEFIDSIISGSEDFISL